MTVSLFVSATLRPPVCTLLRFSLHRPWPTTAPTRIQLCGRLAVELEGRELTPKLPGGQARVLFTYLTVNRALPARREELIEALWPWRAPPGADASLSALLSRLRAVLGADVLCGRGESSSSSPRRLDRPRGRARGDPPRRVRGRPAGLGARLGSVAGRAVRRAPRLPAGRGPPLGRGAPPPARGDPRRGARVLRRGRARRRRLRARAGRARRARAGRARAVPRTRARAAHADPRGARQQRKRCASTNAATTAARRARSRPRARTARAPAGFAAPLRNG